MKMILLGLMKIYLWQHKLNMAKARTIIEEPTVSNLIDGSIGKFPRLEDSWYAWKWRLSRDPQIDAICVPGSNAVMMIKSDPKNSSYKIPSITILYSYSDNDVIIIALKVNN